MHIDYTLEPADLPPDCIVDCSQSGDVSAPVFKWRNDLDLSVDRARAIACLNGYGAWDDLDTWTDERLAETVLWLACCTFAEGDDLFVLE